MTLHNVFKEMTVYDLAFLIPAAFLYAYLPVYNTFSIFLNALLIICCTAGLYWITHGLRKAFKGSK
ncbi:DUF6007 family protein [Salsuginibacillus kocurii]|uniref:DUF6007 family protein n=1 Tax=Salsuginibacillus kocurii TaxID=427078 RepID=UPI0003A32518|nr:DUF6007 family protein [Salsuginibacillus kocurii]